MISEEDLDDDRESRTGDHHFHWEFKDGFVDNFDKIYQEFKIFRRAKTIKIFVTGMPGSGKSYYSEKLADQLNVPHICLAKFLPDFIENTKNPIADRVRQYLSEEKVRIVAEANENLEKDRAKKKKNLPAAINEDDCIPKISDELLQQVINWRLSLSDC